MLKKCQVTSALIVFTATGLLIACSIAAGPSEATGEILVRTIADGGEGSLRYAIEHANTQAAHVVIRFDTETGPFASPQRITLTRPLPPVRGKVTIDGYIDGRLWQRVGVTISGNGLHRVFAVSNGATAIISSLTIADGNARQGGGIANRGELVVKGVTFKNNVARQNGGGLVNLGGTLTVINSTFVDNEAEKAGGGLAVDSGQATLTNCTFSSNRAPKGGGLFSMGTLLLRNTILANSVGGLDCVATGRLDPGSTHNLIESFEGCGEPISSADPKLQKLGYYNGPTETLPLVSGSPAINRGDNSAAVDDHGKKLRWDQRGNGDPRFVGGITDIGAFEQQAATIMMVDTVEDIDAIGCNRRSGDCSLRGAITLANARRSNDVITFDPKVFSDRRTITLTRPLPEVTTDLTVDASESGGITLKGEFARLTAAPEANLTLNEVAIQR